MRWIVPLIAAALLAAFIIGSVSFQPGATPQAKQKPGNSPQTVIQLFDTSSGGEILFSKTNNDLWLLSGRNQEQWIGSNVVRASFSSDGQKFAYATSDEQLFVWTIKGELIAHVPQAYEFVWPSNSAAIVFSASPSREYPDFEQTVIFHLNSQSNSAPFKPQ